jgi:hypothetical protein
MTAAAVRALPADPRTGKPAYRTDPQWPLCSAEWSCAPSVGRAQRVTRTAAAHTGSRLLARGLLLVGAATLAGLMFNETRAMVGDPIVAAMLTLNLAIPFAYAFCGSPAHDRPRS